MDAPAEPRPARKRTAQEDPADRAWRVMDELAASGETGPQTFGEIQKMNLKRKELLVMARTHSPLSSALKIRLLPRTVVPRLLCRPLTYVVLGTFGGTAVLAQMGITETDIDPTVFDGAGTMVVFMIIFYVGYCYTRYGDQFKLVQVVVRNIIDCCAIASTSFNDPSETMRLYRYLNMLHAASYTALSTEYSQTNFFDPIVEQYELLAEKGSDERAAEIDFFRGVDIDAQGGRTWTTMMCWSLEVVERQFKAGGISPPVHAQLNKLILDAGDATGNLFAFSYQVLPFIYTQLVALSCTMYLVASAFLKGINFHPSNSFTFGLIVPGLNVMVTTLAIFGLLEVGDTVMDPFGGDPEDYAVLHFVEHTATASLECICGTRAHVPPRLQPPTPPATATPVQPPQPSRQLQSQPSPQQKGIGNNNNAAAAERDGHPRGASCRRSSPSNKFGASVAGADKRSLTSTTRGRAPSRDRAPSRERRAGSMRGDEGSRARATKEHPGRSRGRERNDTGAPSTVSPPLSVSDSDSAAELTNVARASSIIGLAGARCGGSSNSSILTDRVDVAAAVPRGNSPLREHALMSLETLKEERGKQRGGSMNKLFVA